MLLLERLGGLNGLELYCANAHNLPSEKANSNNSYTNYISTATMGNLTARNLNYADTRAIEQVCLYNGADLNMGFRIRRNGQECAGQGGFSKYFTRCINLTDQCDGIQDGDGVQLEFWQSVAGGDSDFLPQNLQYRPNPGRIIRFRGEGDLTRNFVNFDRVDEPETPAPSTSPSASPSMSFCPCFTADDIVEHFKGREISFCQFFPGQRRLQTILSRGAQFSDGFSVQLGRDNNFQGAPFFCNVRPGTSTDVQNDMQYDLCFDEMQKACETLGVTPTS